MKEIAANQDVNAGREPSPAGMQDARYVEAIKLHGASLSRLVCGYEKNVSRRQDLTQEIHIALWKSFAIFDERCALQTWMYRIAHNVAIRFMMNSKRIRLHELHTLEDIVESAIQDERASHAKDEHLQRLFVLIEQLKPLDRQVILLYLEEQDAKTISDITGLSAENVATKIHRIKKLLQSMFRERGLL